MAERQDDPFQMKGRRPPPETEGGMQDTSLDEAERDFAMRGDTLDEDEDYDLDTTVFTDKDGNPYYLKDGRKLSFEKAEKQLKLKRWKHLREVFSEIRSVPIRKTDNHQLF